MANIQPVNISAIQLMTVTMVFFWLTMNKLNNGFNARIEWFGFTMTDTICDYQSNDITFLYFCI